MNNNEKNNKENKRNFLIDKPKSSIKAKNVRLGVKIEDSPEQKLNDFIKKSVREMNTKEMIKNNGTKK